MRSPVSIMLTVLVMIVVLAGCDQKPPESTVIEMVKEYIPKHPNSFCGFMTKMEDIQYRSIRIEEYGNYNKEREYWPVRIRVVFSAECGAYTFGGTWKSQGRKNWNKKFEWKLRLREDDYGNKEWVRLEF